MRYGIDRLNLLFVTGAAARVLAWSDAKQTFKVPAEMALAGEASLYGDLDRGDALGKEEFGAGNAELSLVKVWREADFGAEDVVEVEGAEIGELSEARERDVFGVVFMEVGFDALDGCMFVVGWKGRETSIAVVEDVSNSILQERILFKLGKLVVQKGLMKGEEAAREDRVCDEWPREEKR